MKCGKCGGRVYDDSPSDKEEEREFACLTCSARYYR